MAGVLKNLGFRPLSVIVLSTGRYPRVLVKWDLLPTAQILKDLYFFVDRGESPTELKPVSTKPIPANALREFIDYTANTLDLQKVYYYRVRAVEYSPGPGGIPVQTFTSETVTWDGKLDLVALYVVTEHLFLHQEVAGVPVMIYKQRHEGARCPECWDEETSRVTKSNCRSCKGTGFLKGYYDPFEAWMNFEPDPKAIQVAQWGKQQPNQTDIQFTNYPLLTEDDVVVELKINKMWKVVNVRTAEKNRTTMLQIARVSAVNPADAEYMIDVPEDRRRALIAELEARDDKREF